MCVFIFLKCRSHILRCTDATQLLVLAHSTISDLHAITLGEFQHERVKGRGRGKAEMKRERTVADLSTELQHSRRKRPPVI